MVTHRNGSCDEVIGIREVSARLYEPRTSVGSVLPCPIESGADFTRVPSVANSDCEMHDRQ